MTLGRLVLETARGTVKERTVSGRELAEIRANMERYFRGPLQFREPQTDSEVPVIYDATGNQVAMLYWPGHPVEETAAAEQATYALGHAMAAAIGPHAEETFPQPPQTAAEMDLESACNWLAGFADSESPVIRTYVRRLLEQLRPRPGTLAGEYAQKAAADSDIPSCNPCTQWDEDGLCITCGAAFPLTQGAWNCGNSPCRQLNSAWANTCGRCGHNRPDAANGGASDASA